MIRLLKRIHFFLSIALRPVTGPSRDEPPMTDWEVWWKYSLDLRTAWEISGISWSPEDVRRAMERREDDR